MKKNSTIYIYIKQVVKGSKLLLCTHDVILKVAGIVFGRPIAKKKLCRDPQVHYFIKNKHLGDAVRTMPAISLFKHYKQSDGAEVKIVVLTRENLVGLVRCCNEVNEIRVLSKKELDRLQWYATNKNNSFQIHPDASTLEEEVAIYEIPDFFANKIEIC